MEWTRKQIIETQAELEKWHGLPHIDRRALEGKGIDCIHLVFQALYASKLIEPRKLPAYRVRWGLVSPENMMVHPASINPIVQHAQELVRLERAGWKIDQPDQIKLKDLNERK